MRSKKYGIVKKYFDKGLWNANAVRNAVIKSWITAEEYEMIVSESYIEEAE